MSKDPSGTLDACIDLVEAVSAYREAVADVMEAVTPEDFDERYEKRRRAHLRVKLLPIPTPEQLADLRERVK